MKYYLPILMFFISIIFSSCDIGRHLPKNEKLYKGAVISIIRNPEVKESKSTLKETVMLATRPIRNKFIFGFPYKVWFWYKIGEPKSEKGFKAFLRKKLAEPPVLSSRVNVTAASENIQSLMENLGYFHSTAKGKTTTKGDYITAVYDVNVQPQYLINEVTWVKDTANPILSLLEAETIANGLLISGNPYRLSDITAERERLDIFLKTKGYYYFHPDYLMAYADSTIGNRKVNLLLNFKKSAPAEAKRIYKITSVKVYPDFSLSDIAGTEDSAKMTMHDKLLIKESNGQFKNELFERSITYRPDTVYNTEYLNATLNRLISLGAFKFVKNRFDTADMAKQDELSVSYLLTPSKKKYFQTSLDGFSKDNSFVGSKLSVNWRNKNAFHGAEQLSVKVYGGFEVSLADSLKVNNNFRAGTEVSLKFPKYAIPFVRIKENSFYPANTSISLGYEWYQKRLYYTKNFFRLQYEFVRKPTFKNMWVFAPVSLSYSNAINVTDSFYSQLAKNPALLTNIYAESVVGSFLSFTRHDEHPKDKWYVNTSIDLSGNIAGVVTGARNYREKKIIKAPFAQYVKFDLDVHYTRKLTTKINLANRFQLGLGIPYNNSRVLPFSKLYTVGGSSSLRGFNAGTIGPGTLKITALNRGLYQLIGGDMKLLFNSELRVPFSKYLSYAVFADAGNTWTKDTLLFGPSGKISKYFLKEIAVCGGVGLRFDATILLIRADFGVPFRKPFLPESERWVFNKIALGTSSWRKENLIFNIAIGLPF